MLYLVAAEQYERGRSRYLTNINVDSKAAAVAEFNRSIKDDGYRVERVSHVEKDSGSITLYVTLRRR